MIDKVVVYRDTIGEWRLTVRAANGKKIMSTGEGYKSYDWAVEVAGRVFPGVPLYDSEGKMLVELPDKLLDPLAILRNVSVVPNEKLVAAVRQVERLAEEVATVLADLERAQLPEDYLIVTHRLEAAYAPFKPRPRD